MTKPRIDRLSRWLAGAGSRRNVLRATLGAAGALAAAGMRIAPASAESPPPIPNSSPEPWPVCSETRRFYCVESFSVDGVDYLGAVQPDYELRVTAINNSGESGEADRVFWFVLATSQPEDRQLEMHLRLRTGLLEPVLTFAHASEFSMEVMGGTGTGWLMDAQGKPGFVVSQLNPQNFDQAAALSHVLTGTSIHRTYSDGWGGFEGYVQVDGIRSYGPPVWQRDGWQIGLNSVHLLPDGSVNHGSYRAWISPRSMQKLQLTPGQAVSGELRVSRTDDGLESPVGAVLTEQRGGVLVEIPDLTFSSPTISMRRRSNGGCAMKCRRGRVCKNGRCKKKKKKNKRKN